jgi:UDP-N-acetylmuramoyl-tripeptide--D-alanyl-D-alanine ligase
MEAAIVNLKNIEGKNKIAIIGDMLELGEYSVSEHKKILGLLKAQNFQQLIFVGPAFNSICTSEDGLCFANTDSAYLWLKDNPFNESIILLKASRGIKLEKLVDIL